MTLVHNKLAAKFQGPLTVTKVNDNNIACISHTQSKY